MLYYSESTKKFYKTEKELEDAEQKFAKAQEAEAEKLKIKKARATEVEDAYKAIKAAKDEYLKLRDKFIDDYGSYHMTYRTDDKDTSLDIYDVFTSVFHPFGLF